jgi:hypothetical protein
VVNVVADGGALAQPFAMGFIGREYFRVKSVGINLSRDRLTVPGIGVL